MPEYQIIRHPRTGEVYAVELDNDGWIIAAGGPLHHADPTDPAAIRDYIANQSGDDLADIARWLRDETGN